MGVAHPTAAVLTGYPVDPDLGRGGAQRVAGQLCDRLVELGWTVEVIECAAWRESVDPHESVASGTAGRIATARRWRDAGAPSVLLPVDVDRAVREAGLVLVLDRAIGRLDTAAHRVLLLSNLAYDNERRAAADGDRDAVWVPSHYLAQRAAASYPAPDGVHVVPPALTALACDPRVHRPLDVLEGHLVTAAVPRNRRLLFPHRTDPGKGLVTALAVLRHLVADDRWMLVAIGPGSGDDADAAAFLDDARRTAAAAGTAGHVVWVPWLPRSEMPCLYRLAGVTLMPSTLDEGFGLAAVESVAEGVPVVARSSGNLRLLADRFPDVHLADELAVTVRTVAAVSGRGTSRARRRAVREVFSVPAQRAAVRAALDAAGARA